MKSSSRTLAAWLTYQESVHPRSIALGLDRVRAVAQRLGRERPPFRTIVVGGTNGKGSTVAYLEALAIAQGLRVGAFTSPHLLRYTERIRIDGREATDDGLVQAFERIEAARGDVPLTFFEYNALAALESFAVGGVELGVLEVGLGGRLDAVNLIDADVAVLVSVGLDHLDWLGPTVEDIGREKAGIFRAGRPAVLGTADMPRSVFEAIERIGAVSCVPGVDFRFEVRPSGDWDWSGRRTRLPHLPPPALAGDIQYSNAATALAAFEALGAEPALTVGAASAALRAVGLTGRLQIVPADSMGGVEWIFDVAHNPPAATVLADALARRPRAARTIAVAGVLADKDLGAISAELAAAFDDWILCGLDGPRGMAAHGMRERLAPACRSVLLADDVVAGCELAARLARSGDRVVVFGSFHTVGPALEWLARRRASV